MSCIIQTNYFTDTNIDKILVSGCAGFIGFHVCYKLLLDKKIVIGLDNMATYDNNEDTKQSKFDNVDILKSFDNFLFISDDICTTNVLSTYSISKVIHLAAIAGVRFSLKNPILYEKNNVQGFIHLLEECVKNNVKQLVYASSSSVYGTNTKIPFTEIDITDNLNSPYACTKLCMEIYAKTYSRLYNLNNIGLRFFTVYGPRGRRDMAPYIFMDAIKNNKTFFKYGDGSSYRDYTYIDDIVGGIISAMENKKNVKCEIYNLGNNNPVELNKFIEICENITGNKAKFIQCDKQLGDVEFTYADISKAMKDLDYYPKTSLKDGLEKLYNSIE
jgi:UDP-glucuronate 4-epimerase